MYERISKIKIKDAVLLKQKKHRDELNVFVAEGEKIAGEVLQSDLKIKAVIGTNEWLRKNNSLLKQAQYNVFEVNDDELIRISNLKTPNKVLVVIEIPEENNGIVCFKNKLSIVLDDIQDPGNLGTIIRLADWFGIENVICSEKSADVYNPKVIQASMGAFLRVKVHYKDLAVFFNEVDTSLPVYGAYLEGNNIYNEKLHNSGLLVMGNESKGISKTVSQFITNKITIPSFSMNDTQSESLNVSVATAIICSEFRRTGK
jgi:TrmH family RNA methyltransferase